MNSDDTRASSLNPPKPRAYSYLRFSTLARMEGDSFRRQSEAATQYAQEQGLELDDTLTFRDLGVSAYHGSNVLTGSLGSFIAAVRSGKIKAGSYLLVESLDRLSRQDVWTAFTQFSELIKLGIRIVTLQDRQTYSLDQGEMGFSGLITSIVIMQRACATSLIMAQNPV